MPKKAPRNAFYFFMLDFKEEQKRQGINYGKMNEVADAASPFWRDATPQIRSKYEAMAKKAKQVINLDEKYTSMGVPLSEIEQREKDLKEAEKQELQDIRNIVVLKSFSEEIFNEDFYIMDVNYYCKVGSQYLIGEFTILRFNLKDGIHENYHEMINPGHIPMGYASDVKLGAAELGLDPPDEDAPRCDYMQILANIIDYLKKKDRDAKVLPPIFTVPEKILSTYDFIQQMCNRAGEDDSIFRIYRLDTLFYTLINAIKSQEFEGFPKASLALVQLKKDPFKYSPGIGCAHHEEIDKATECTMSRAKRWAYTVMDSCCPVAGIELRPGSHLPPDYDMDSILNYREQSRGRLGLSVAGNTQNTSACNSSLNETNESLPSFSSASVKKEKRDYTSVRMPKADYSQAIRPAPELSEDNFPKLSAGYGRGRGMGGSYSSLKSNK